MSNIANSTSSDSDSDDMMEDTSIVWFTSSETERGVTDLPPKKFEETHSVNVVPIVVRPEPPKPDPLLYTAERLNELSDMVHNHIKGLIHRAEVEALALKSSCKRGRKRKRKVKA